MHSQDKNLLINSMQKLISHITLSKSNQEEIYDSLTKNDLKKIIQNLNQNNPKLRKVSLTLLSLLLYQNIPLKIRFCELLNIALIPGKICINSKITKNIELSQENKLQLVQFLKEPVKKQQYHFVIWIINMRKNPLTIDFISYTTLKHIDPLDHLVGFILQRGTLSEKVKQNIFQKINVPYIDSQRIKEISKQKYIPFYTQRHKSYEPEFPSNDKRLVKKSIKQSLKLVSSRGQNSILGRGQNNILSRGQNNILGRGQNNIFTKFLQPQSIKSQKGSPKKYDLIFQKNRRNTQVEIQKKDNILKSKNTSYNHQETTNIAAFKNNDYSHRFSLNAVHSKNQHNNSFHYVLDTKHKGGIQITTKTSQLKQKYYESKNIAVQATHPINQMKNTNSFKQKNIYKRVTQKKEDEFKFKPNQHANKTIILRGKKQTNQDNKIQRQVIGNKIQGHPPFMESNKHQSKNIANSFHFN